MISLTRLSGSVFALNSDLIERVDSTPDTVITLVDGSKYVVAESLPTVLATVRRHRAEVVALGGLLAENPQELIAALAAELDTEGPEHPRRNLSVVSPPPSPTPARAAAAGDAVDTAPRGAFRMETQL